MPLIPVGRLQVATPATMAAAVRGDTDAATAVDERIVVAAPGIFAADATLKQAAAALVEDALAGMPAVAAENQVVVTDASWTGNTVDYFPATFPATFAGGAPVPRAESARWPRVDDAGHVDESVIPPAVARVADVQAAVDDALAAGGGGGVATGLEVAAGFAVPAWGQSPVSHSTGSALMLTGHVEAGAASFETGATVITGSGWQVGQKVTAHSPDGLVLLVTTATGIDVDTVLSGGTVPWLSLDGAVVSRAG